MALNNIFQIKHLSIYLLHINAGFQQFSGIILLNVWYSKPADSRDEITSGQH